MLSVDDYCDTNRRHLLVLLIATLALFIPYTVVAQTSTNVLLLEQADGSEIWSLVDQIASAISDGNTGEGVEALSAAYHGRIAVQYWEQETIELRLLDGLLATKVPGKTVEWPGAETPRIVLSMYNNILNLNDPALRAAVLRAASGTITLDPKPLILEGERLTASLAHRFGRGMDRALEEEALAYLQVCKGRMTASLAAIVGDIARYSQLGSTAMAARSLARAFYSRAKK